MLGRVGHPAAGSFLALTCPQSALTLCNLIFDKMIKSIYSVKARVSVGTHTRAGGAKSYTLADCKSAFTAASQERQECGAGSPLPTLRRD